VTDVTLSVVYIIAMSMATKNVG